MSKKNLNYVRNNPLSFCGISILLSLLVFVLFAGCLTVSANADLLGKKKVDEGLGAWVSDDDTFIITFFNDNTFLKLSSYEVVSGSWRRHEEKANVVALLFRESGQPTYVTVTDSEFIWHHLDYDDSGFCRLLQGRGANLKIKVIDLDKTKKRVPIVRGKESKNPSD